MNALIDTDRLREENRELQPVLSMFNSEGWRWMQSWLTDKQAECQAKLYLPNGVQTMDEVLAFRQRLGLINELLDMPEDKAHKVEMNNRDLIEAEREDS